MCTGNDRSYKIRCFFFSTLRISRGGGGPVPKWNTHKNLYPLYSSTKTNLLTFYRGLFVCSYMKDYLIQVCDASLACLFGSAPFCKNLWKRSKKWHVSPVYRGIKEYRQPKCRCSEWALNSTHISKFATKPNYNVSRSYWSFCCFVKAQEKGSRKAWQQKEATHPQK